MSGFLTLWNFPSYVKCHILSVSFVKSLKASFYPSQNTLCTDKIIYLQSKAVYILLIQIYISTIHLLPFLQEKIAKKEKLVDFFIDSIINNFDDYSIQEESSYTRVQDFGTQENNNARDGIIRPPKREYIPQGGNFRKQDSRVQGAFRTQKQNYNAGEGSFRAQEQEYRKQEETSRARDQVSRVQSGSYSAQEEYRVQGL